MPSTPIYTRDYTDRVYVLLRDIAAELEAQPRDMAAVMFAESGMLARGHNPNGGASGLIQFMPATLRGLGWTLRPEAFRALTAEEQLCFVRAYYLPHRGKLASVAALYVATFLPALLSHASDPAYVLVAKGGARGWAYAQNAGFDVDRDMTITVAELEQAVVRQCRGPRWQEILFRLGVIEAPASDPARFDLRTTYGIQQALTVLGFDPGILDGIPGPKTRAAVMAFQASAELSTDGIPGPLTRGELAKRLVDKGPDALELDRA